MTQTILNLTGIGLDLIGFIILLREWWITVFGEQAEIAFDEMMAHQSYFDELAMAQAKGGLKEHMVRSATMRADHRLQEFRRQRRDMLRARRSLYFIAVVLIVLGSMCQLLSAVPVEWLPFDLPTIQRSGNDVS